MLKRKAGADVKSGQKSFDKVFEAVFGEESVAKRDDMRDLKNRIAYVDADDGDALTKIADLMRHAILYMDVDTERDLHDIAKCLMQIDFAAIDSIAENEGRTHPIDYRAGKPKWTTNEASAIFETYVAPALAERFSVIDEVLYFREMWGYWRKIGSANLVSKMTMLAAFMIESVSVLPSSRAIQNLMRIVESLIRHTVSDANTIIQFNDCVITQDGTLSTDAPESFPRFIFDFNAHELITRPKPVSEVDDLLLHLANGNEEVAQCLLDRLSMAFVPSAVLKNKLGPKAVMLFGPTGENGKSTLANLLMNALRRQNCTSFSFEDFTGYSQALIKNNLLLIDPDASSVHVSPSVSTGLKRAITADTMCVREIYRSPETVTPVSQFMVCTNAMPKAEDKTRGWDRRLEWYEVKEKLVRDDAWFKRLDSQEAADYMLGKLISNAIRLVAAGEKVRTPDAISDANKQYSELNRNVKHWLDAEVLNAEVRDATVFLDHMPSAMIYDRYCEWCKENGETPLGLTNFNSIVTAETGMVRKFTQIKMDTDPVAFAWWQEHTTSAEKFTATKMPVTCWILP